MKYPPIYHAASAAMIAGAPRKETRQKIARACDGVRQIAQVNQNDYEIPDYEEAKANADLIAEAGTVYHETGLTPREILAQRDQIMSACALALAVLSGKADEAKPVGYARELLESGLAAIQNTNQEGAKG